MRAVLVGRVSTRHDSQETSLERQRAELEELARRKGWTIVGWFHDRASGAEVAKRPGLGAALDELFRGRADLLVVHDLDRLGRNAREMLATVDALHAAGKSFYVRDAEIDATGPMGRFTFTVFAAVHEFYRRDNRRKVMEGQARARGRGKVLGAVAKMDWGLYPRVLELRAEGATWPEAAKAVGQGSDSAWSSLYSRSVGTPCPHKAQQPDGPWNGPWLCCLYKGHGQGRHLDPLRGWWQVTPTGILGNAPPNPATQAALAAAR